MRRILFSVVLITFFAPVIGFAQILSWQYTGSLNETRWVDNLVTLPNGTVLTAGGVNENGDVLASCEIFNPASATWSETTPMNQARQSHTITTLPDGRIVVIGGQTTGEYDSPEQTNSIEIFDPSTKTWSSGGALIVARQNHTATLLEDSTILIVGGYSVTGDAPTIDTTGDSIITYPGGNNFLASCEIYNPATHSSRLVAHLIQGRDEHSATLLKTGEVLVEGGRVGGADGTYFNECEIYNPVNNTWRVIDPMAQPRIIGCLTTFSDGTTLASGGRNSPNSCAPGSEILDPSTLTWSSTDPMKLPVHWPANVLLPFNNFIATGGLTDGDLELPNDITGTATCEWYDRFDRKWYYAPKMNQARCKHAAVYLHQELNLSLPFDLVLVAGGLTGDNTYTNTCEILDIGSSALASYKANLNPDNTLSVSQKLDMAQNVSLAVLGNTGATPVALFSLDKNENARLEIVNSVGVPVEEVANMSFTKGVHNLPLNILGLSAGAYFVCLETLSGNAMGKLLVIK